jgi:L-rhamnose-H+ transport protein
MSYGMAAGKPIAEIALQHGAPNIFQNLPVLIVVLAGGFTSNFIWCVMLNIKNKSGGDYLNASTPLISNYVFSAIAGTTWYLQFFFYSMGQTKMGKYEFSSWTLHMASIIIFSTLWGIALREWKGTSTRTHILIAIGLAVLIGSTVVVGYGNYLGLQAPGH